MNSPSSLSRAQSSSSAYSNRTVPPQHPKMNRPKAMQIYEPWMEPDYYMRMPKQIPIIGEEKQTIVENVQAKAPTPAPLTPSPETSPEPTPQPTPEPTRRTPNPPEPDPSMSEEDRQKFVKWVMNGRMDDFGEAKHKLFKNLKDDD